MVNYQERHSRFHKDYHLLVEEEENRITKFLRKIDVKWLESEAVRLNKKGWNTHIVSAGVGDNVRYALYKIKDYK